MFKRPRDVEVAILVVVKELEHTEEYNLGVVQNTFSPFTDKAIFSTCIVITPSKSHTKTQRYNSNQPLLLGEQKTWSFSYYHLQQHFPMVCDWLIQETANCRNYRAKPNAES